MPILGATVVKNTLLVSTMAWQRRACRGTGKRWQIAGVVHTTARSRYYRHLDGMHIACNNRLSSYIQAGSLNKVPNNKVFQV